MSDTIVYIHGKGGSASEAEHYKPLFKGGNVTDFDYKAETPWDAKKEFAAFFRKICKKNGDVILIANSIGAFFSMCSLADLPIKKAFFISPIVNMEKLIADMLAWSNHTEEELRIKGKIETDFGETLSWEYLKYVRENPIGWKAPASILYGGNDNLTSLETVSEFSERIGAKLTVMENGEHWFHTKEQMDFLDSWIKGSL